MNACNEKQFIVSNEDSVVLFALQLWMEAMRENSIKFTCCRSNCTRECMSKGEKGEALRIFDVEIKWELVMNASIVYDLQELF
jgi:hypothetical protein